MAPARSFTPLISLGREKNDFPVTTTQGESQLILRIPGEGPRG